MIRHNHVKTPKVTTSSFETPITTPRRTFCCQRGHRSEERKNERHPPYAMVQATAHLLSPSVTGSTSGPSPVILRRGNLGLYPSYETSMMSVRRGGILAEKCPPPPPLSHIVLPAATTTTTSMAVGAAAGLRPATGDQVRSKFLNMIGIESKLPPIAHHDSASAGRSDDAPRLPMSCNDEEENHNLRSLNAISSVTEGLPQEETNAPPQPHQQLHGFSLSAPAANLSLSISPASYWQHPRTQGVACFTEALKYDRADDERYSPKRRKINDGPCSSLPAAAASSPGSDSSTASTSISRPKKTLGFRETVDVVPIPMRTEYSTRVKSRIWSTAAEIYQNAARNTVEFASEGWDWRKVTEDESMYVCVATGELIHPCHYEGRDELLTAGSKSSASSSSMTP